MSKTLDTLAPLLFNVEKVPMKKIASGYETNTKDRFAIVGYPETGKKMILNTCSDYYNLVKNSDVLIPIIELMEKKFKEIKVIAIQEENCRFHVSLSPARKRPIVGQLLPRFTYSNSYDGTMPAALDGGTHRTTCANGATIEVPRKGLHYRFNHKEDEIVILEHLESEIQKFMKSFPELEIIVEKLQGITFAEKDLSKVLDTLTEKTLFPKKAIFQAAERAHFERSLVKDSKLNLWLAYNGLNYVLNHDRNYKIEQQRREQIDKLLFAKSLKLANKM